MSTLNNPKSVVQQINILSLAMLGGITMLGVVGVIINQTQPLGQGDAMTSMFLWVVVLVGAGGIVGSNVVYKHFLSQITSEISLMEKLEKLRTATIIKLVLIEAPALLAGIAYLLTGSLQFLLLLIGIMVFFWFQRPSRDRIITDLSLSQDEQAQI